jgi:hypothetical protein
MPYSTIGSCRPVISASLVRFASVTVLARLSLLCGPEVGPSPPDYSESPGVPSTRFAAEVNYIDPVADAMVKMCCDPRGARLCLASFLTRSRACSTSERLLRVIERTNSGREMPGQVQNRGFRKSAVPGALRRPTVGNSDSWSPSGTHGTATECLSGVRLNPASRRLPTSTVKAGKRPTFWKCARRAAGNLVEGELVVSLRIGLCGPGQGWLINRLQGAFQPLMRPDHSFDSHIHVSSAVRP